MWRLHRKATKQKQNITINIEHLSLYRRTYCQPYGFQKDSAQLTFNGIGKINKGMNGSDAQQESRAMILSETARADANPILLIDEYDVKAGHAAGVGKIDEEQLYYLMSRGLTRRAAEILIIYGFLMPFIDDIRSGDNQTRIREERLLNVKLMLKEETMSIDVNRIREDSLF